MNKNSAFDDAMELPIGRADRRIPCLDGMRGLGIILILIGHLSGTPHFLSAKSFNVYLAGLSFFAVRVFFVFSGFLITTLLLNEMEDTGSLSLARFYRRRTLRIFPAAYLYIGIMAAAAAGGWIALRRHDVLCALLYLSNYHLSCAWQMGQLWSLAVEEQFYLLWPALLCLAGRRRAMLAASGAIAAAPFIRGFLWLFFPSFRGGIGATFITASDALAIGCFLAGSRRWLERQKAYGEFLSSRAFFSIPIVLFVLSLFWKRSLFDMVIGQTAMNLGTAVIIHRYIRHPHGPVGRFLNFRPLVNLGLISYSLYLWQQPFANRFSAAWIAVFPVNLLLALACAAASYHFIEKPFLRLRNRIEAVFDSWNSIETPCGKNAARPGEPVHV